VQEKRRRSLDESNRLGDYPGGDSSRDARQQKEMTMGKGTSMKKEKKKPKKKQ